MISLLTGFVEHAPCFFNLNKAYVYTNRNPDVAIAYIRVLFEEPDIMKKYSGVALHVIVFVFLFIFLRIFSEYHFTVSSRTSYSS